MNARDEFIKHVGENKIKCAYLYKDGSWSERGEYDGSEWWEYKSLPEIQEALI